MLIVKKFGGTSVATVDKIKAIAKHLVDLKNNGNDLVVVVSAMGKKTNELIRMANEVSVTPNKRELDTLLSIGEQQTIALLAMAINELGSKAISLTGLQAGFLTTDQHTKSRIIDIDVSKIKKHLDESKIVVVAGFQGVNACGDITTLGRGGSDTTAVAIAAKLKARCEIYTDVLGVYSVDPSVYPDAKLLDCIDYDSMMQMAHLGSGVLEPRSVEIAKKYNVPLYVGKTLSDKKGTDIMNANDVLEQKVISGISVNDDIIIVTLKAISNVFDATTSIFAYINEYDINVDMIAQTTNLTDEFVLSFSCNMSDLNSVRRMIEDNDSFFKQFQIIEKSDLSEISLVGVGMATSSGVSGKVFKTLSANEIPFYHITTSQISISTTIDKKNTQKAVSVLAKAFDL